MYNTKLLAQNIVWSSLSMLNNKSFKLNRIALIGALIFVIPGVLLGQVVGVMFSVAYTPFISLGGGFLSGIISYIANHRLEINNQNFYRVLTTALAMAVGGLWGGLTIAPFALFFVSTVPTSAAITMGIIAGLLVFLLLPRLVQVLFRLFSFIASQLNKIIHNKKLHTFATACQRLNKYLHTTNDPFGIMAYTFGLIGMTLCGCLGLIWGPLGWIASLHIGTILGISTGIINNLLNNKTDLSKVLSSLFGASGTLIGVMLGAIIATFIPVVSPAIISMFFGLALMLSGLLLGNAIGDQYRTLDLNNPQLMHKIYIATLLVPIIFLGYLSGGVLGFIFLPMNQIILSQAVGMVVTSGLYGLMLSTYYVISGMVFKQPSAVLASFTGSGSVSSLDSVAEANSQLRELPPIPETPLPTISEIPPSTPQSGVRTVVRVHSVGSVDSLEGLNPAARPAQVVS